MVTIHVHCLPKPQTISTPCQTHAFSCIRSISSEGSLSHPSRARQGRVLGPQEQPMAQPSRLPEQKDFYGVLCRRHRGGPCIRPQADRAARRTRWVGGRCVWHLWRHVRGGLWRHVRDPGVTQALQQLFPGFICSSSDRLFVPHSILTLLAKEYHPSGPNRLKLLVRCMLGANTKVVAAAAHRPAGSSTRSPTHTLPHPRLSLAPSPTYVLPLQPAPISRLRTTSQRSSLKTLTPCRNFPRCRAYLLRWLSTTTR